MKFFARNTVQGLIPLYPADQDEKRKLKLGQDYEVEVRMPRNVGYHRKFFALMNIGHQNTKMDMPFETYRIYIVTKAGYFKAYQTPKGVFYEADSISFSSMPQDVFEDVYSRCMDVIISDIGSTSEDIERALIDFM